MKRILFFCSILFCISCSTTSPFDKLQNDHVTYEGAIENYSVGPTFYPKKDVIMELWFPQKDFIYGYWKEKGSSQKHYLKGEMTTLRTMYGSNARKERKEDNTRYGYVTSGYGMLWFKEMSGSNANYRIRLIEYRDEHFSDYTDNAFYVYNFEDGKFQGSYYAWKASYLTNGRDSWSTGFTTLFHLERTYY
jgi:hypothetical protein